MYRIHRFFISRKLNNVENTVYSLSRRLCLQARPNAIVVPANKNNANILELIFNKMKKIIKKLIQKGDCFVLDRGFRDVKDMVEKMGYIVSMPALKGRKSQLSTEELNDRRFVTKLW